MRKLGQVPPHGQLKYCPIRGETLKLAGSGIGGIKRINRIVVFAAISAVISSACVLHRQKHPRHDSAAHHLHSDDAELIKSDYPIRYGGNLLTTLSGCRIAQWLYTKDKEGISSECGYFQDEKRELRDAADLREHDTIFVPLTVLERFVDEVLGRIRVDVVVISGQTQYTAAPPDRVIAKLLENAHVLQWFCQNLPLYGGGNLRHFKLSPFPYGLKETGEQGRETLKSFIRTFLATLGNKKSRLVYAGPLGDTNANRTKIPSSPERLKVFKFHQRIAASRYVISPSGDRPETYRHYEAIGLGAVPITELDPFLFRHLAMAPAMFGTKDWNEAILDAEIDPSPVYNRNFIFEGYWLDWIDDAVGVKLNWQTDRMILNNSVTIDEWFYSLGASYNVDMDLLLNTW